MDSQLLNEISALSDEELEGYIDTFENRVETTRDYLDDADDINVSMVMRGKLQEYSYKLRLLKEERNRRGSSSVKEHPARPAGVKITREMQVKTHKAYISCPDFLSKIPTINNPVYRRELSSRPDKLVGMLCKEDCLFPTCPFYDSWSIANRVIYHPDDYDEWVVQGYENRFKK
jgi:hypothetical protein